MARHIWEQHGGDPKCLSFSVVERVCQSPRKGDWDRRIQKKEAQWIYRLCTVTPGGLNERLTFSCFL